MSTPCSRAALMVYAERAVLDIISRNFRVSELENLGRASMEELAIEACMNIAKRIHRERSAAHARVACRMDAVLAELHGSNVEYNRGSDESDGGSEESLDGGDETMDGTSPTRASSPTSKNVETNAEANITNGASKRRVVYCRKRCSLFPPPPSLNLLYQAARSDHRVARASPMALPRRRPRKEEARA